MKKIYLNVLVVVLCLFIQSPISVIAGTLKGELVEISIEMDDRTNSLFHPNEFSSYTPGSSRSSDWHYRYAEAVKGKSYGITIRLKDCTKKYAIAIAVDGIDVIDGEQILAVDNYNSWPRAYVFDCGKDNGGTIKGWRESQDHVREFVFTDAANSLAAKWDDYSAMGTIVVSVFRENIPEKVRGLSKGLGTGYGERLDSHVDETKFEAKEQAYEVFVIKYETKATLKKLGVWREEVADNRLWPKKEKGYINFPD